MVYLHATIGEHALELSITDGELQVPPDCPQDDLRREIPTLERVLLACCYHEPLSISSPNSPGGRKLQSCNRTDHGALERVIRPTPGVQTQLGTTGEIRLVNQLFGLAA
jgi:hypothetical protein